MANKTSWEIEVSHAGLGKYRHIRGSDKNVVEQKANYQEHQWNEQWQRKLEADSRRQEKELASQLKAVKREALLQEKNRLRAEAAVETARKKKEAQLKNEETQRYKDERKQEGIDRDSEAKAAIDNIKNTLIHTLKISEAIDWNKLKDKTKFKDSPPKLKLTTPPVDQWNPPLPTPQAIPVKPTNSTRPNPPLRNAQKYRPAVVFLDKIITSRIVSKTAEAEALFQEDHLLYVKKCKKLDNLDASEQSKWIDKKKIVENKNSLLLPDWQRTVDKIKEENRSRRSHWERECDQIRTIHINAMKKWEQRKDKFCELQAETNKAINTSKKNYEALEQSAVSEYCNLVLSNSIYPDYFPKDWDLDYNENSRTLLIEYVLPSPEVIPTLKEVKYIQMKDDFKETHISEKEREALYESLLYQIALRTIHEQFEADTAKAIDAVTFNGIVTAVDKTTGHNATSCILSILAQKEPFLKINLADIDPKACFKSLKGVAASKLVGLTAISPVMFLDKSDRRFVNAYGVTDNVNERTNLATMDWEDFEHLIRELFAQEFESGGGEVKVTHASRDGGVDAVAFDPDPIRGGKIVIQAKRYANTVEVSAVRDLFGTVMNEGAMKGILVTTADYGPDAYEFAKGKPLALLNGSNLLNLLEKHGHKARINLNEAKLENKQALIAGISRKRNRKM